MSKQHCEFQFAGHVDMDSVERILLLAVISAEGIHGRSRVRLDARYDSDLESRICTVNTDNEVGQEICRVFTEFLTQDIGDERFGVETRSSSCDGHCAMAADRGGR